MMGGSVRKEELSREDAFKILKHAGLRPTRQRVGLAKLLFAGEHRHVCAEELYRQAREQDYGMSMATVYNTLQQFTKAGLLGQVCVDGTSLFDTNADAHFHFYDEQTGVLSDIPLDHSIMQALPSPPAGKNIQSVDLIIRLSA